MTNNPLSEIAEAIKNGDDFAVIPHVSPDGDAIGSCLGLYQILLTMNKRAVMVCDSRMPPIYSFLPYAYDFGSPETAGRKKTVITVDCADKQRLGGAGKLFDAAELTINIDHHATNDGFAMLNYVQGETSSCCEVVYELAKALGVKLDEETALCLYMGIMTDTGRFSHSNTNVASLTAAAELMQYGFDVAKLNRQVYSHFPVSKMRLLARALNKLELLADGRIGLIPISQKDMLEVRATNEDCEGIVERIRDIDTVELAIFIRQAKDGSLKVSMRSNEYANVAAIAEKFGGGGHERAAGYTSYWNYQKTYNTVVDAALREIENGD